MYSGVPLPNPTTYAGTHTHTERAGTGRNKMTGPEVPLKPLSEGLACCHQHKLEELPHFSIHSEKKSASHRVGFFFFFLFLSLDFLKAASLSDESDTLSLLFSVALSEVGSKLLSGPWRACCTADCYPTAGPSLALM